MLHVRRRCELIAGCRRTPCATPLLRTRCDRQLFDANVRAALASDSGTYQSEYRVVAPGGDVRWLSESGRVEFDALRRPIRLIRVSHGYEVCRRLRALPGGSDMTITALTGWGQHDDRVQSALAGFDQHLVKPVDPETLVGLLRDPSPRVTPTRTDHGA